MKKLDKFILKAFLGPFMAVLLVVTFILLLQFLWVYIDELVGKGLGFRVIAEFMLWASCTVLPLSMPLSTLLASMMTLGQMAENFELTAIKASGTSIARIMTPIFIACAIVSVGAFFICNNLVPYATNRIYTLRDDIGRTKSEIKIPVGTFYDGIDGYILRIGDRDDRTGTLYDVMVYDHSARKGNIAVTVADSGIMRMSKAKDYLTFTMYDGTSYQEDNIKKFRDTTYGLQRINFAKQELIIPLENYAFQSSGEARFGDQVKSMNLKQLRHGQDSLQHYDDSLHMKHLADFNALSVLRYRSQLDTSWKRKSVFEDEDFLRWDDMTKEWKAYETAEASARQMESSIKTFSMDTYESTWILRRTNLEILKKFAQALACLILFFIGAPLGALIGKGGIGSSAVVSALFFVLYWVVDITGAKLSNDGATSAFVGAFISAMVLLPIGIFLTWRAIREKPIFGNESTLELWRKIKSKVISFFRKTRIVYMGTPEFAVAPLKALLEQRYKVVGVVTVPDKPSGRGLKVSESAVKTFAVEKGLPVLQPEKLKDPEFLKSLAALKGDIFVVVGFRMLPEVVWKMPKKCTFNLHAALLPQYRGAAPINWAVINGERVTGVTTFLIDSRIDTGGIILRSEHMIGPTDTAGDVHDALMETGAKLVVDTVEGLIQGNVETRVQRSFIQGSELLKPAPKLTRELCHIDWDDNTRQIVNLIRGLSPYPAAWTELVKDGVPTQLKIFKASAMENAPKAAPGTVLSDGKTYLAIATANGAVALEDVQLSGKKRMDVKAFLAGFREPEAYVADKGTSKAEIAKAKPLEDD